MKQIISFFLAVFSPLAFAATQLACPFALPPSDPNFCASFPTAAVCHCSQHVPTPKLCQDLNTVYKRMIATFGSLENACKWQRDTDYKTCVDDWNCYRLGGVDSDGNLCSGTGRACV